METALILLAIVVAVVMIPLGISRITRRRSDNIDGYLDEQHGGDGSRKGSWPAGGGHLGA